MSASSATYRPAQDGLARAIAAVAFFAAYDTGTKYLSLTVPLGVALWVRYMLQTGVGAVALARRGNLRALVTRRWPLQLVRGGSLLSCNVLSFLSFKHLPVGEVTAILMLTPLLVTLASAWQGHEQVSWRHWSTVLGGMGGAWLIIRPGMGEADPVMLLPFGLLAANVVFQVLTSRLAQHDSPTTIFLYTSLVGAAALSLALPWAWQAMPTAGELGLLLAITVFSTSGHHLLVSAYARLPASRVTPYLYFQIAFATLGGWWVFAQAPDGWALSGILLIMACGIAGRPRARDARCG